MGEHVLSNHNLWVHCGLKDDGGGERDVGTCV